MPRIALASLVATLLFAACGGATSPQEPVVEPGQDGGDQDSPESTEPNCIAGETACKGMCTDTQSDPSHCGTCGTVCAHGQDCNDGLCVAGGGNGDGGRHHD
jgi:hypothetical protein